MTDALCIIPARSGSKRVPGKNIRHFFGRPIISRVIETALLSGCFSEVMVSTESHDIAKLAIEAGAKVPFLRSASTAGDEASTASVVREVLDAYESQGRTWPLACCIYPTAVLLTCERLKEGHSLLERQTDADTVMPVHAYEHPIERAFHRSGDRLQMINADFALTRQQEVQQAYYDAGQFYWLRVAGFLKHGKIFAPETLSIVLSAMECQDINTEDDWRLAELKWELKKIHDPAVSR